MKKLQLFINGKEIIASDGLMYVDGRFNISSVKNAVIERNNKYAANFPNKVANGFSFYKGNEIRNGCSNVIEL